MTQRLRLALQKKGRLALESVNLLISSGLKFRLKDNALVSHVENLPIDLLFVRDDDIPGLVFDGLCDGGIIGENVLQESSLSRNNQAYQTLLRLNCCQCRLSIATPDSFSYSGPASLEGKRIATSYPQLLQAFLDKNKLVAQVVELSGSVEVAPRMGIAEAICDLVSTGQTLEENQLVEVEKVMDSQAIFIQNNKTFSPEQQNLFTLLSRRFLAVQQAKERKYIMFHAPRSALPTLSDHLPGMESPTIIALPGQPDKVAVHVVSSEKIFWSTLERIQDLGASSILVLPIEKMLD